MPPECEAMARAHRYWVRYRHWRVVVYAGALGFFLTLMAMETVDAFAPQTPLSIALAVIAGSLSGVCVAGALSGWHIRRKLSEQNRQLDVALNNMI